MSTALVPLNNKGLEVVRAMEPDFNELIAQQHYLMTTDPNGNPQIFIKKAGLLRKLEDKFANKAIPQAVVPTIEEESRLRKMMGLTEEEPCVIFKGIVYIPGLEIPFVDWGSARPRDTRNGKLLEVASTRAILRAIRLATNCGFTSVEEMTEDISFEEAKVQLQQKKKPKKGKNPLANDFRIFFIQVFCKGDASKFDGKQALKFFQQETGKHWQAKDVTNGDWNLCIAKLKSMLPKPEPDTSTSDLPDDIAQDQDSDDLDFTLE